MTRNIEDLRAENKRQKKEIALLEQHLNNAKSDIVVMEEWLVAMSQRIGLYETAGKMARQWLALIELDRSEHD